MVVFVLSKREWHRKLIPVMEAKTKERPIRGEELPLPRMAILRPITIGSGMQVRGQLLTKVGLGPEHMRFRKDGEGINYSEQNQSSNVGPNTKENGNGTGSGENVRCKSWLTSDWQTKQVYREVQMEKRRRKRSQKAAERQAVRVMEQQKTMITPHIYPRRESTTKRFSQADVHFQEIHAGRY
jgi:hypothetical protein